MYLTIKESRLNPFNPWRKLPQQQEDDLNDYKPTVYLFHHSLQSIFNIFQKRHHFEYERQKVFFEDGGHVTLDWVKKIDKQQAPPVLLIFHGLTGGSQTNYIRVLAEKGQQEGYQCVVLNHRGINSEMTSHIPFTGLSFLEVQEALKIVEKQYPFSDIYLLGASFGGNYIMRYLSSVPKNNRIKGTVLISPPINLSQCVDHMGPMYQKFFVKKYLSQTLNKCEILKQWQKDGIIDFKEVNRSKNLKEFHTTFTVKVEQLDSYEQVYEKLSITEGTFETFQYPTLLLAAKDDPIVSYSSLPLQQIRNNQKIRAVITKRGGHLCWYEGLVPQRWYPKPIFKYLKSIRQNNL